jgi:lysophospholipase L1-like esterase
MAKTSLLKRGSAFIFVLIALLATSLSMERFVAYQRWTLKHNGNWLASKSYGTYHGGLMGAHQFMSERQPLAGRNLNLAEWHGFNEISYNKLLDLQKLDLKFKLLPESYLWIFFDQDGQDRIGIRLSRNSEFPSGIYRRLANRKLLQEKSLPLMASTENHLTITSGEETSDPFRIKINEQLPLSLQRLSKMELVTLKAGTEKVFITSVTLESPDATFREDFKPPWSLPFISIAFLLISALCFIVWLGYRRYRPETIFIAISLCIFILTQGLINFDRYFYAPYFFYSGYIPGGYTVNSRLTQFEEKRAQFFSQKMEDSPLPMEVKIAEALNISTKTQIDTFNDFQWLPPGGSISYLKTLNDLQHLPKTPLLLIVGTSQAWGAGASAPKKTWFYELATQLNKKFSAPISLLNISKCGSNLKELNPQLEKVLTVVSPKAILVNIGSNDQGESHEEFEGYLKQVLTMAHKKNAKVIFSLEPENYEIMKLETIKTHAIMKLVSGINHIPLVDARSYFVKPEIRDSGFLFWDIVHFDDWGHLLFANLLIDSLDWQKLFKD